MLIPCQFGTRQMNSRSVMIEYFDPFGYSYNYFNVSIFIQLQLMKYIHCWIRVGWVVNIPYLNAPSNKMNRDNSVSAYSGNTLFPALFDMILKYYTYVHETSASDIQPNRLCDQAVGSEYDKKYIKKYEYLKSKYSNHN